jgi:uncharacterized integral membrane protein
MPWKLIGFIILLILIVVFSGLNVQRVEINFGLTSLVDVPLFVLLMGAFIFGTMVTIPFVLVSQKKRYKKPLEPKNGRKYDDQKIKQKKSEKETFIAEY